ncbi:galactoside alpha-(1,2)-fucosyltransferase 2-like [Callorhinchus milii]|uniref:galactoside alpha-(1,2)-fucosyltransferase 2-like n=1 Tax=Callorhinchus milii TaxID=7868 RepID=UPI001C3F536F|nr:galactoside alpha-(1,2)-fucosyltransferase 2-like [Callorhinchus milii]
MKESNIFSTKLYLGVVLVSVTLLTIAYYLMPFPSLTITKGQISENSQNMYLSVTETNKKIKTHQGTNSVIASKGFWTINSIGRLGNQMGEYATLYALAKLNGKQGYIPQSMANYLSPIFRINLPTLHESMWKRLHWKNYHLNDWMEDRYRHIPGDYVKLTGYPCSWTFYHHIREEILREFTFHDYLIDEANTFLRSISKGQDKVTYVAVHVRRGDYVHTMPNIWKGVVADKGYLEKAMSYFRKKYSNVVFVVTSEGMDWCKDNIDASKGDVHFSGDGQSGSPARDFSLLAHCNHTIMTIGTFGIWAAYLAGGETIYLSNYTLPDSPFLKLFKYEAAFLPEWIGIPADLSPVLPKKP